MIQFNKNNPVFLFKIGINQPKTGIDTSPFETVAGYFFYLDDTT